MSFVRVVADNLVNNFESSEIYPALIASVLLVVTLLSIYEFIIYHVVLHRSLYNKAFNICVAILPFFISTIILCLQSNLIITLGTIGALAIIRFRTAVKDPVDMIFLLWAIHIGIVCGCQLYELAVAVSLVVTVVLIILNNMRFMGGTNSKVLIVHLKSMKDQSQVEQIVKKESAKYRVKSRNFKDDKAVIIYELYSKNASQISEQLSDLDIVLRYSLMEYDSDDIL